MKKLHWQLSWMRSDKAETKSKGSYRTETSAQADDNKKTISVEDLESMIYQGSIETDPTTKLKTGLRSNFLTNGFLFVIFL